MPFKHLFLVLLTVLSLHLFGQNENVNSMDRLSVKAGYFGEFVMHPGFYAGVDYNLFSNHWLDLHWDNELGGYSHRWNNNAAFVQSALGVRFNTPLSLFVDLSAGVGGMVTTPNGDVYSVNENKTLVMTGRPYSFHLKPSVSLLFGWNGNVKKQLPVLINAGIELYQESAFNHTLLPHAAIKVGLVYQLKKN